MKKKTDFTQRYTFKIPIGDWSKDGHGQCEWYFATANKPVDDVRKTFFKAKKLLPEVDPETFCNQYQDGVLPEKVCKKLKRLGVSINKHFDSENMVKIVVWFLNQGDPKLDVVLEPEDDVPMLPFYGFDSEKRHIGFFGYGLFAD